MAVLDGLSSGREHINTLASHFRLIKVLQHPPIKFSVPNACPTVQQSAAGSAAVV